MARRPVARLGERPTRLDIANTDLMGSRDVVYRDIMALARRRASDALFRSDAARRAAEDAHLGLIPGLLHCDDERRHRHYLRVDRVRFARACRDRSDEAFRPLWDELERLGAPEASPAAAAEALPLAKYAGPIRLDYGGAL